MRANSNEKDGGAHPACRVVGPIARVRHAQAYTATGGKSPERKPIREVVGGSPTHESSMKRQKRVTSASHGREPRRALARQGCVPHNAGSTPA